MVQTRAAPLGIEVIVGAPEDCPAERVFAGLFQYPGTYGNIRDFRPQVDALHANKALAIMATDLLALTMIVEPGALGADIAVGSAQRFGVPMGYGGPHAAFIACQDGYKRSMPGRIVGVSVDARGNQAYRLSLQTREQHIRREKATSNVCTAQALLAVMASMYAVFHGPKGLRAIAERVHGLTERLYRALRVAGAQVVVKDFFDTITVEVGVGQAGILAAARAEGLNLRKIGTTHVGISLDETSDARVVMRVLRAFGIDGIPPHRGNLGFAESFLRQSDLPDPSDLPHEPGRDRDDALYAPPVGPRLGAGPRHDPSWVLHHEAERGGRDDPAVLARIFQPAPVLPARSGSRLCRSDFRPEGQAVRDHWL